MKVNHHLAQLMILRWILHRQCWCNIIWYTSCFYDSNIITMHILYIINVQSHIAYRLIFFTNYDFIVSNPYMWQIAYCFFELHCFSNLDIVHHTTTKTITESNKPNIPNIPNMITTPIKHQQTWCNIWSNLNEFDPIWLNSKSWPYKNGWL